MASPDTSQPSHIFSRPAGRANEPNQTLVWLCAHLHTFLSLLFSNTPIRRVVRRREKGAVGLTPVDDASKAVLAEE